MINNLYSIRDQKTQEFEQPFLSKTNETAKRTFGRILDSVPVMTQNPQDFDLYHVGDFSNETALVEPCTVQLVTNGLSLVEPNLKEQQHVQIQKTKVGDEPPVQPST